MDIEQAIDSVYGHFKTVWDAAATGVDVIYDETPKNRKPDDAGDTLVTPFIVAIADLIDADQATLGQTGNRRFRRNGVLTVTIYTPKKQGRLDEDRFAKIVFDGLEGECTTEGVELFRVRPLTGFNIGAFRVKQLNVDFEYDEIK